jgi:hypothetical protein
MMGIFVIVKARRHCLVFYEALTQHDSLEGHINNWVVVYEKYAYFFQL